MNECKDCKHECQKCEQNRFALELKTGGRIYCQMFTPKPETATKGTPKTAAEIDALWREANLQNSQFMICNGNSIVELLKQALQSPTKERPQLEEMLIKATNSVSEYKECEAEAIKSLTQIM